MDLTVMKTMPSSNGTLRCERYYDNKTYGRFFNDFEGIPGTAMFNLIIFVVMVLIFSILRKSAWDYGRIALIERKEKRHLVGSSSRYNVWMSLFYAPPTSPDSRESSPKNKKESMDTTLIKREDVTFFDWIPAVLKLRDRDILQKCGQDAVQFLMFQRYLIMIMGLTMTLCIAIVLPINITYGQIASDSFGRTTIHNFRSNSPYLWIHCGVAVIILGIVMLLMRNFATNLKHEEDEEVSRTLMIAKIPKNKCYAHLVVKHFEEAYPDVVIEEVQFAYNIRNLIKLEKIRQANIESLEISESLEKHTGVRPTMMPYMCGELCCCPCCIKTCGAKSVDSIEYYKEKVDEYTVLCDAEKVSAYENKIGFAFVTFENEQMAFRVNDDFLWSCKGGRNRKSSSVSRELNAHNWDVTFAPEPENIFWENLSVSTGAWWVKAIIANIILVFILSFLTTPTFALNQMNTFKQYLSSEHNINSDELLGPVITAFIPTVILIVVGSILPTLVTKSDLMIGHWTKSMLHLALMRKTYIFLILMQLVLPSLGLTSFNALLEWFVERDTDAYKFRWGCVFLPKNAAFYVHYSFSAALITSSMDLARLVELGKYVIILALAKSSSERKAAREEILCEFPFGIVYSSQLCIFTIVMAFSIPCPIITIPGFIYLCLKHFVDKHNLYFVYLPSKIDPVIHATAINFVIVAVFVLIMTLLAFIVLQAEKIEGIAVYAIVLEFLILVIFCGRLCFGWFKPVKSHRKPAGYKRVSRDVTNADVGEPEGRSSRSSRATRPRVSFLPNVLGDPAGQPTNRNQSNEEAEFRDGRFESNAPYASYGTLH